MIKTFTQAVKLLEKYIPTPKKKHPGQLGLSRMEYLVSLLGNPQFTYPTIHVGGTSGKGSTATIIASILSTKYKVGLHTSPHLVKVNERIKILENVIPTNPAIGGGVEGSSTFRKLEDSSTSLGMTQGNISDHELIGLLNEILPVVKKVEKSKFGKPSYFEIVTALAFLAFQRAEVDIAVIEVGMGGRFDGTNVIKPLVAVLTNVGLDHTEVLGNTVEKIAKDKVGIIKPGIQVVAGVKQSSVIKTIKSKVKSQKSKISLLGEDFNYRIKRISDTGSAFDYFGEHTYRDLKLSLLGLHQVENAALAIKAIEIMIKEKDIRRGLLNAFIPGRLEIVSKKPLIILDGAHNEDKARALTAFLEQIFPQKKITAIIAIKEDKNAKEMLETFLKICQQVIFTKFKLITDQGVISSYEPEELLEIANSDSSTPGESLRAAPGVSLRLIDDPMEALKKAVKEARKNDLILVTGSLYLVGEIKKMINSKYQIPNSK